MSFKNPKEIKKKIQLNALVWIVFIVRVFFSNMPHDEFYYYISHNYDSDMIQNTDYIKYLMKSRNILKEQAEVNASKIIFAVCLISRSKTFRHKIQN